MAKLMMGTSEVLKVMMGSTEVTSLFMGSEEISQVSPNSYLIIEWANIPNDGNQHICDVYDQDGNNVSELIVDIGNADVQWVEFNPDIVTDSYDDQGDISQGWIRLFLKGPFNGEYHIQVDGNDLNFGSTIVYDGSEMVYSAYSNGSVDDLATYSCYDEWDCVTNGGPGSYWDGSECVH